MLTETELQRRKPVWTAFSEFWLDTEIDDADLWRIAAVAAASGYNLQELRDIYLHEVAPVVGANLLTVAGEWAGFDEEWLHAQAHQRAERRSRWLRFWLFVGVGRALLLYATERHWRRVVALLPVAGQSAAPSAA